MGKLWEQFYTQNIPNQIPHKVGLEIYSIYTDYEADYTGKYTCIIGQKVNSLDTIPDGLAKCYRIQRLDLSNNQLVGTIPEGFGDCENLMNFDLSNNKLTGNVPEGLDGCEYLWGLNLSGNQLSHNIPAALKKHPNFSDFKF